MKLSLRILLITMLFVPALLIAQESIPEKPLGDKEPSANKEPLADKEPSANKEPSADKKPQDTQDDKDFKPSEEISEDFPVPLPSDI